MLLNRPQQLNALSDELMDQLVTRLQELDRDDAIRCIVLGGSERVFAAGADIGELARSSAIELYYGRRIDRWDVIRNLWTPLVAAVSGYCLGGGCELALACDLIVEIDDTPVASVDDVQRLMVSDVIGTPVRMRVVREGRPVTVELVPAELDI